MYKISKNNFHKSPCKVCKHGYFVMKTCSASIIGIFVIKYFLFYRHGFPIVYSKTMIFFLLCLFYSIDIITDFLKLSKTYFPFYPYNLLDHIFLITLNTLFLIFAFLVDVQSKNQSFLLGLKDF